MKFPGPTRQKRISSVASKQAAVRCSAYKFLNSGMTRAGSVESKSTPTGRTVPKMKSIFSYGGNCVEGAGSSLLPGGGASAAGELG